MPGRRTPLVTEEIYHILNRGVASQPTFIDWRDYKRAIETMVYYQNLHPPQKYSIFLTQAREKREEILRNLKREGKFWVEIIAYCFMPNHFHFLLKQKVDEGISKFLSNFANSYTQYFNGRHHREGHLFKGRFQAVRIESDEQLWHVSRYIHLNPYSSLPEYLGRTENEYCQKEIVLDNFPKRGDYKKFVFDQADYQRSLERAKHLWLEE